MSSVNKGYLAVIVIVVIVIAGLGAFLYFNNNTATPEKTGTIIIGASVSTTGSLSVEGTGVSYGIHLAVNDINAAGGFMVNGVKYNITLRTLNDQSDKSIAASNYKTLLANGAQFLIGPYGSSNVLSVAPVVEAAGIPMVQAGGSSDSIFTQGYKYTFGLYRLASTYSEPVFSYLNSSKNVANIKSIAVFVQNEPFSVSVFNGTQRFMAAIGFTGSNSTSLHTYFHASNDLTTIDSQMTALKNAGGADLILSVGHYADAKQVVQDIHADGLSPKVVFGTVGVDEPTFVTDLGTAATNTLGFSQWVPNIPNSSAPGITNFVSEYNSTYKEMPSYHGAGGYAAVQTLITAIENANSLDPAKVRDALANINTNNIWGHVQFTPTGYITGSGFMVQVQNGAIVTVAPTEYATKSVVYPF